MLAALERLQADFPDEVEYVYISDFIFIQVRNYGSINQLYINIRK